MKMGKPLVSQGLHPLPEVLRLSIRYEIPSNAYVGPLQQVHEILVKGELIQILVQSLELHQVVKYKQVDIQHLAKLIL